MWRCDSGKEVLVCTSAHINCVWLGNLVGEQVNFFSGARLRGRSPVLQLGHQLCSSPVCAVIMLEIRLSWCQTQPLHKCITVSIGDHEPIENILSTHTFSFCLPIKWAFHTFYYRPIHLKVWLFDMHFEYLIFLSNQISLEIMTEIIFMIKKMKIISYTISVLFDTNWLNFHYKKTPPAIEFQKHPM